MSDARRYRQKAGPVTFAPYIFPATIFAFKHIKIYIHFKAKTAATKNFGAVNWSLETGSVKFCKFNKTQIGFGSRKTSFSLASQPVIKALIGKVNATIWVMSTDVYKCLHRGHPLRRICCFNHALDY